MSIKMKISVTITKTVRIDPEDFDFSLDDEDNLINADGDTADVEELVKAVREGLTDDYEDFIDWRNIEGKEEVVVEVENKS